MAITEHIQGLDELGSVIGLKSLNLLFPLGSISIFLHYFFSFQKTTWAAAHVKIGCLRRGDRGKFEF